MDDVARLQQALGPVQKAARGLPWAKERPWTTATHVGWDGRVPTVDLHDLGRKQAAEVVDAVVSLAGELDTGAVFLVVGRGRRSLTGAVLPTVVRDRLVPLCTERGWQLRIPRAGRFTILVDPARAPAAATGALGWGFWIWALIIATATALAVWRTFG